MARLLFAILLWPAAVLAQSEPPSVTADPGTVCVDLSWQAPTENTDGTPLTDLTAYRVYYGLASGEYTAIIPLDDPALVTYTVCDLAPATEYFFAMTAWNSTGQESDFSTELVLTTDALRIGEDLTVYTLVQTVDRIALVPVGTVPPDTECDPAQSVNGMHLVPVESVTWAGTVESEVVVGACE